MNRTLSSLFAVPFRTTLDGAMKDATRYANDIVQNDNGDALEGIRKADRSEVISLALAQKAAWKKALVSVHRENESRVGKETLEAVCRQTGFKP